MKEQQLQRFGPFIVVREIGRGGMGEVLLARTPWPEAPLAAVKRLRADVARIETFAERFRHEADLAVRLSHPHLVGTLGVGTVGNQLYVASELVLGRDVGRVADRLRERGLGGPTSVGIRIAIDGLMGLAYVHRATDADGSSLELIHRDVTPGNIMVGYDGFTRLADFGLAKSLLSEGSRLTRQGEIVGTPHYLAPELVRGDPATTASDIYGLGAVLYRFFTGIAPYQGTTTDILAQLLSQRPRPLAELRPDLPDWVTEVIGRMLTREPNQRPKNARKLAEEMTRRASVHDLLVSRNAVGSWLIGMFSAEHTHEMVEYRRFQRLDLRAIERSPEERSQIFARAPARPSSMYQLNQLPAPGGLGGDWVRPLGGSDEFPTGDLVAPSISSGEDITVATELREKPAPDLIGSRVREVSEPLNRRGSRKGGPHLSFSPESTPFGQSTFFMVGLLSLAVALGLGLGKVVGGIRGNQGSVLGEVMSEPDVVESLDMYREHMRALRGLRDVAPEEVWWLMAEAAAVLLEGDNEQAFLYLRQVSLLIRKVEDNRKN
ncbi:MAG: serine/threonine protein kinase [Myxococcales bacterium]|nr:serine/threonine protein kinase [Myxococcales bacterium]